MSRSVQVFNPVHNHKFTKERMNVMGRVTDKKITHISVYLDKALIRRVRVGAAGAFELRLSLADLEEGKHEIEVRTQVGHRTERLAVPFYKATAEPGSAEEEDDSPEPLDEGDDLDDTLPD